MLLTPIQTYLIPLPLTNIYTQWMELGTRPQKSTKFYFYCLDATKKQGAVKNFNISFAFEKKNLFDELVDLLLIAFARLNEVYKNLAEVLNHARHLQ